MNYTHPLVPATLIKRYKRFLADVTLPDGTMLTVHVPNTGSLMGCVNAGLAVRLSDSMNDQRKYRFTLEQILLPSGRVGINTHLANQLVGEALKANLIPALSGFTEYRSEVKYGDENSRIDWLLSNSLGELCYVEVKNVTAAVENGVGFFPDAPSERATKHCRELIRMVQSGNRAAMVFCVQREDVTSVMPADHIDPHYGMAFREAVKAGVEIYALGAELTDSGIGLTRLIPVYFSTK